MSQGMHEQRWYRVYYALCRLASTEGFFDWLLRTISEFVIKVDDYYAKEEVKNERTD